MIATFLVFTAAFGRDASFWTRERYLVVIGALALIGVIVVVLRALIAPQEELTPPSDVE